jgi:hypothetical protein
MVTNKKEGLTWFVPAKTAQDAKENISEIGYDIEDLTVRHATARDVYIHRRAPSIIEAYRKEAARFQRWFNAIQITLIILSSLVTGLGWFASRCVDGKLKRPIRKRSEPACCKGSGQCDTISSI